MFCPSGVDNSTGGMLEINSKKWGPFEGSHIGLSYGSGTHYLILRDATSIRPQGAVVPLEGNFLAGVMRGDFHPQDGQLYVAGLDGWGDYSVRDGCLHRVRYLGGKVRKPKSFKVHSNGIRIDFTTRLDQSNADNLKRYFAPGLELRIRQALWITRVFNQTTRKPRPRPTCHPFCHLTER